MRELPFLIANGTGGSQALDAWYRKYAEREMKDVKFCFAHLHIGTMKSGTSYLQRVLESGVLENIDNISGPKRKQNLTEHADDARISKQLATMHLDVGVELDLGDGVKSYRRETNTMPQWAGSCWYFLRFMDPRNDAAPWSLEAERYWGPVDLYVGGVEHAVLHLLYARFWHKVLHDLGHVSSREPYRRLVNQGYIQAFAYTDSRGSYVPAAEVVERDGKFWYDGAEVFQEFGKIGKSLKNSVSPDEICDNYGADTLRVYEMSMGPLEASRPWATKDVVGAYRFLQRVWRLVVDESTGRLLVEAQSDASAPQERAT